MPSPVASPPTTKTPKQKKKKKKKGIAGKLAAKTDVDADEDDSQLLPPMLTSSNDSYSNAATPRQNGVKKTTALSWSAVEMVGSTNSRSSVARPTDSGEVKSLPRPKFDIEFDESDDENNSTNGTATEDSARFNFTGVASTPIRNNNNGM